MAGRRNERVNEPLGQKERPQGNQQHGDKCHPPAAAEILRVKMNRHGAFPDSASNFMNSPLNPGTPDGPPVSEEVKTPPNDTDSDLWTSERVAQYLHVSLKSVFNLRKKGLPFVKVGGAVRFVPQEIKDHLLINRGLAAHRLRQIVRKGAVT